MTRVTGIGGFFFRARDPETLNRWYAEHLGVAPPTGGYEDPGWFSIAARPCSPRSHPTRTPSAHPRRHGKINFRVDDLDGMVAQLRAAAIDVHPHDREYPNGRFAELADPEGNRIQL